MDVATCSALTFRPFLIAMTGRRGTGKSHGAGRLAWATGAELVSSDAVRKQFTGVTRSSPAEWQSGIYIESTTGHVYRRMIQRVGAGLERGTSKILNATFLDQRWRDAAAAVASTAHVAFFIVETVREDRIVRERIADRSRLGQSASDATIAIYEHQLEAQFARPPATPPGSLSVRINTSCESAARLDPVFASPLHQQTLRPCITI